jgi:hypothetical protein
MIFIGNDRSENQMSRLWNLVDYRGVFISDCVVTTATLGFVSLFVIWFGGCAEVGQFSADDAQKAASIATAVGDSVAVRCWPILETTGNAVSAAGNNPGILVGIEEKRAVQTALRNTLCQPVWAGVLAELLKATPAAPFVP